MMSWMRCEGCGHVFTDGYLSDEVTAVVFRQTNSHQQPGWEMERMREIVSPAIERIARHVPDGDWLDIGFGNGALLFAAQEWGYRPVGVDLRRSSVEALARFGIEAHCVDIATLGHAGRYSVISMCDVIEHMPFPKPALAAVHRLSRVGGLLFASMPSYDCPLWRHLDAQNANPYWGELEHYHNFSRARFCALLLEMGFEPVDYAVSVRYRVGMEIIARRV
jgi:2-polyprenyl-3-methyl-5-hydroxy-6-metoxy-1,4-benzoquinol methylase